MNSKGLNPKEVEQHLTNSAFAVDWSEAWERVTGEECAFLTGEAIDAAKLMAQWGYRKVRLVNAPEELDALPTGSVIRTAGTELEEPWVAVADVDGFWDVVDEGGLVAETSELSDFPITVLWEPES